MSDLPYYKLNASGSPVGPIDVVTYLQWLRASPYSLVRQQQNDILYCLQVLEATQLQERKQSTILSTLMDRLKLFLSPPDYEDKVNNENLTPEPQYIPVDRQQLDELSTQAYQAQNDYYKTSCDAAEALINDIEIEDLVIEDTASINLPLEKSRLLEGLSKLKKAIFSHKPTPQQSQQIHNLAQELHPAIPLIVLGGVPVDGEILTADQLIDKKYQLLLGDITNACNKCVQHLAVTNDDETCNLVNCHVKQHLLAHLMLCQNPRANARFSDLQTVNAEQLGRYQQRINSWHNKPQRIENLLAAVQAAKKNDIAQNCVCQEIYRTSPKPSR